MKVLIPLTDGFEEIEAITPMDILRRAGFDVVTAGIPSSMVTGAHMTKITTDVKLDKVNMEEFDAIVLVGGPGYKNLANSSRVMSAIRDFDSKNKLVAAICMAPSILTKAGIIDNKKATIYPGQERQIPRPRGERVVVDGNIITSQAPGTAMEFSLKIVEKLMGKDKANELKRDLLC
jgi:4-methyl-5(b-hydroxyethyl)-thiazole monophosphate biosynthesis